MPTIRAPTENNSRPTYTSKTGAGPSGRAAFLELRGDIVPSLNFAALARGDQHAHRRTIADLAELDCAQILSSSIGPIDVQLVPFGQPDVAADVDLNQFAAVS